MISFYLRLEEIGSTVVLYLEGKHTLPHSNLLSEGLENNTSNILRKSVLVSITLTGLGRLIQSATKLARVKVTNSTPFC